MIEALKQMGFKQTSRGYELEDPEYGIIATMDVKGRIILTVHMWTQASVLLEKTNVLDHKANITEQIAACKAAITKFVKESECKKT
jgi:hypothetical protein